MKSGCLYIDDKDVYLEYGVYVIEGGWNELMSFPPLKAVKSNDWPEEDGIDADLSAPVLNTREVTVKFAIAGDYSRYFAFLSLLSDQTVHTFKCVEIGRTFRLRLTQGGNADLALRVGTFSMKFADDYPLDGYSYLAPTGGGVAECNDFTLDSANLTDYGVRVLQGAISEIKKSPNVKTAMLRNIASQAGAIYDTSATVIYKSKDVKLPCLLRSENLTEMWRNYYALLHDLTKPNERTLGVAALNAEFPCYYKQSSVSEYTVGAGGRPWLKFTITLCFTRNLLAPYLEQIYSYGVEFDTTDSSPQCVRIGNLELHKTLPIQSKMRGCLLDDEGNVVQYLHPAWWTGETRDGSLGQVMVEIPQHYRKFETEGTKRRVLISERPLEGYHIVPKRYVSAYEATLQRSTMKLSSVANETPDYRGGDNLGERDNTYRSLLGRPVTKIGTPNFRTYARNRNAGSTKWNLYTYGTHKAIYWLFVVEYATLNSQENYIAEKTSEGYAQGGLGMGTTTFGWDDLNNFCGCRPFVPCGLTDEFGNGTGVGRLAVYDQDGALITTQEVTRYRGIEHPFGHIWKFLDGIVEETTTVDGTNVNKVFVATDPAKFDNKINDGYKYVGNQASSGYGTKHIFGERGEVVASEVNDNAMGGGRFLCDASYCRQSGKRCFSVGGPAYASWGAGLANLYSNAEFGDIVNEYGTRLCFIPTTDD